MSTHLLPCPMWGEMGVLSDLELRVTYTYTPAQPASRDRNGFDPATPEEVSIEEVLLVRAGVLVDPKPEYDETAVREAVLAGIERQRVDQIVDDLIEAYMSKKEAA